MNVKNAVMNAIAWMTSTQMCTVYVLVILVSVMTLKILGRNVCHVNKGERQDGLQIYSIINCVDGGSGFVRWTGRL
jgi:hypothetical protein